MVHLGTILPLAAISSLVLAVASRPIDLDPETAGVLLGDDVGVVALSLLQQGTAGRRSSGDTTHWSLRMVRSANSTSTCSPLKNHGTHFTVEIEVGTPGQKFDVVADTGSDNVIVASCICRDAGRCRSEDKCFRGTNQSLSFKSPAAQNGRTPALVLTFGSGQIEAVLASDTVKVGEVQTRMDNSVLLMVDQALAISGPFEGILGLGLPRSEAQAGDLADLPTSSPFTHSGRTQSLIHGRRPMGFLDYTGIRRFSMCFNDNQDGVLRLGTPAEPDALGSIGQFHWGLDFRGISVGSETTPVAFCDLASKVAGQDTACGAIPDSGTTVIMADPLHLKSLFEQLCDQWPRCQQQAAKGSLYQKFELFQVLLFDCQDWMGNSTGLQELPPIFFHLVGAGGNNRTLKLDGNSYVFSTREDEVHYVVKHLFGVFPVKVAVPTGRKRNVCIPAFASHKYTTTKNGPVWILGTPLFYEFQVGYDLQAKPPAITFADRPCGSCTGPSLLAGKAERSTSAHGLPREVHGPLRTPSFDLERPL